MVSTGGGNGAGRARLIAGMGLATAIVAGDVRWRRTVVAAMTGVPAGGSCRITAP